MSIPDGKCRHCGDSAERVSTTEDKSITLDVCYGCRNRYDEAHLALHRALTDLGGAQALMEYTIEDQQGIKLGDAIGAAHSHVQGLLALVESARDG